MRSTPTVTPLPLALKRRQDARHHVARVDWPAMLADSFLAVAVASGALLVASALARAFGGW